jgi:uncharacterized protein
MKNKKVIGREHEISILQKLLLKDEAQFVAMYGRRRVGKTFLIKQTYKNSIVFECTALQNATKAEQIENFWGVFSKVNKNSKAMPTTWLQVFAHLAEYINKIKTPASGKKVIFLDEIPWYDTPKSGFFAAFTGFWNTYCSHRSDVLLIICGSAASWIVKKIINNKGGLHNRVSRSIQLQPFTIKEVAQFLQLKKIQLSDSDITLLYMLCGGIPYYLNQVDNARSIANIIDDLFLDKNAALKNEYNNLYAALFTNHNRHLAVVAALANKQKGMSRKEIVSKTKLSSGGLLTETLEELEQCSFITKSYDILKSKADALYRLVDEYSLFYYKFLKVKSQIIKGSTLYNSQKFKIWCGYAFENFCLKHHQFIAEALGISGVPYKVYSFLEKGNQDYKGAQIDMIIDREDKYAHLIEVKYLSTPLQINASIKDNIQQKKNLLTKKLGAKKIIFTTLITIHHSDRNKHYLEAITNEVVIKGPQFIKL